MSRSTVYKSNVEEAVWFVERLLGIVSKEITVPLEQAWKNSNAKENRNN